VEEFLFRGERGEESGKEFEVSGVGSIIDKLLVCFNVCNGSMKL
jgi:hypothetical protein